MEKNDTMNIETGLPGPLDVLLRDLHQLWCDEDGCPPDWHLRDSDPIAAATDLALALWEMAEHPSDEERNTLQRLSALVARGNQ